MIYPKVHDEFETIRVLARGNSIARFGDGELKVVYGAGYVREKANPKLTAEIYEVLVDPIPYCVVGIPTMDLDGPKIESWLRHQDRFLKVINLEMDYYSAFITRPDSAPWIYNTDYALSVQKLWEGRSVTVVCEPKSKLFTAVKMTAKSIRHVKCPHEGAYLVIDALEKEIIKKPADVVLLSIGVTATCLAARLARRGIQALDLGSSGGFILRLLQEAKKDA